MPARQPLELRLTAPATGTGFPVVILSHGFGLSNAISAKDGYAPLARFREDPDALEATRRPAPAGLRSRLGLGDED